MDRDKLIALLKKHHTAFSAMLNVYNHLPFNNSIKGKVKLSTGVTMLKKCRIVSGGTDNEIIIGDLSTLERCEIYIYGSHNTIRLGDRVSCTQACFCIEGDHNRIEIGYHTTLFGEIQLAAIEGTKITIGEECIFPARSSCAREIPIPSCARVPWSGSTLPGPSESATTSGWAPRSPCSRGLRCPGTAWWAPAPCCAGRMSTRTA